MTEFDSLLHKQVVEDKIACRPLAVAAADFDKRRSSESRVKTLDRPQPQSLLSFLR